MPARSDRSVVARLGGPWKSVGAAPGLGVASGTVVKVARIAMARMGVMEQTRRPPA